MKTAVLISGYLYACDLTNIIDFFGGADYFAHAYGDETCEWWDVVGTLGAKKFEYESVTVLQPDLYSLMKAAWFKRLYELEKGFDYDIVVSMRYDTVFTGKYNPPICRTLTLYQPHPLCRSAKDFHWPTLHRVFFGMSSVMDIVCDGWRLLPKPEKPKPEPPAADLGAKFVRDGNVLLYKTAAESGIMVQEVPAWDVSGHRFREAQAE
jgi:hypothetical protein